MQQRFKNTPFTTFCHCFHVLTERKIFQTPKSVHPCIKRKSLLSNLAQYAKHLPQIGEILEFLAPRARCVDEYLHFLHRLVELCREPPLLECASEALSCGPDLTRYFSLLGYLLVLVPTRGCFQLLVGAVERLVGCEQRARKQAVRLQARREALEGSRLPVTLAELADIASAATYPDVLRMIEAVVRASDVCCETDFLVLRC